LISYLFFLHNSSKFTTLFFQRKNEQAKASMIIPTRLKEFHIQKENCDMSSFTFFGLASHH
jgi:hypothetical protein